MLNTEYRTVTKFFIRQELNAAEITKELDEVYGYSAPTYRTVSKWLAEFNYPTRAFDESAPRSARLTTTLTDENIRAVEEIVMCVINKFRLDAWLMKWAFQRHYSTKSSVITWR